MSSPLFARRIGSVYLWYLTLLPAIGTFIIIGSLGIYFNPLLELVVGTAAVGIYLAATSSYTKLPHSVVKNLVLLLDAPLWALVTWYMGQSVAHAIAYDVLIEFGALLLGLLIVAATSSKPTRGQRIASIAIALVTLAAVCGLIVNVSLEPKHVLIAFAGILQGTFIQYRNFSLDDVERDASIYVGVGIVLWVAALFVSYAVALR